MVRALADFDTEDWLTEVEQMTLYMRRAEGASMWGDLRRELRRQGLDPEDALLVESYEDGREEVGVIVARARRVLVYRVRTGEWTWTDISDEWSSSEFADQVQVGLNMIG